MNTKKLTLALLVLWGSLLVSGSALADITKDIKNNCYVHCGCDIFADPNCECSGCIPKPGVPVEY